VGYELQRGGKEHGTMVAIEDHVSEQFENLTARFR
jgi:hypothetical protein